MPIRAWLLGCLLVPLGLGLHAGIARGDEPAATSARKPSARAVELHLLAPCCWTQTLDVHESELATVLRAEIVARLAKGERGDAIEDDFARRYGERVRAVPKGRDPRMAVPQLVGAAMLLSAVYLVLRARRWRRPNEREPDGELEPDDASDVYERAIDEALTRL